MKKIVLMLAIMPGSMFCLGQYNYPSSRVVPVVDNYFGTNVTDNYRWMENIKDSSVVKWFKDQSDYTNSILNKIPGQQTLITEMEQLDSVQAIIYGVPKLAANTFFFTKRLPGEQVSKIYSRRKSTQSDRLLFDPPRLYKR